MFERNRTRDHGISAGSSRPFGSGWVVYMTASPIRPIIPSVQPYTRAVVPQAAAPTRSRGPLPLANLAKRPAGTLRFGLATIDTNGRIADSTLFVALGWKTGIQLDIRTCGGLVLITADEHGVFQFRSPGYVRIPVTARQRCRLPLGDRVLLAADPVNGLLVVHPPVVLEELVDGLLTARLQEATP
ncbi:hypothetical protein ACQEVZ_54835 [Dactylosporangium sp. CA-152071]|uniref:hypothetical protein n=1 Tax=Dactylosporangium sp. CA-152071 TaxID=3239933 RepID=UPI003D8C546D